MPNEGALIEAADEIKTQTEFGLNKTCMEGNDKATAWADAYRDLFMGLYTFLKEQAEQDIL